MVGESHGKRVVQAGAESVDGAGRAEKRFWPGAESVTSATGLNYDAHTLFLPGITQLQFKKTSKAEKRFWERHSTSWFKKPPRCTPPPAKPPWWIPKSPFEFFSDTNPFRESIRFRYTPLPGPWREPVKLRYFEHTPDCPNKISPNDLVDSYDRPRNVRACPHCRAPLRRGKSVPNNWCTPLHWDVATQEVFGERPIPKPSAHPGPYKKYYFESPGKLPIANFVRKGTVQRDPDYPERKDAGPCAVGDYDDWVPLELKYWIADQKKHPLDQNYFLPDRMQGAVRNDFCISRVPADEATVTFKSPSQSNDDEISETYILEKRDAEGNRLTKPLRCVKIEPQNAFGIHEEEEAHAATFHALFNDDESEPASAPDFEPANYRHDPWKLLPLVFENGGSVSRVWWLSVGPGKNVATTDTARLREEYESDLKIQAERLLLLRDAAPKKQKGVGIKIEKEDRRSFVGRDVGPVHKCNELSYTHPVNECPYAPATPISASPRKAVSRRRRKWINTYGLLWCVAANSLPHPTKKEQAEWEKILKGFQIAGTQTWHPRDPRTGPDPANEIRADNSC